MVDNDGVSLGLSSTWTTRAPCPLPSPRVPARTDRGLTIAVEELQPVVNPVIGLFAVGFLGRIRTQRHKRRRREVGVSSWTDFEATFPSGPLAGEPDGPGNSRNCGQLVIPLPPPIPTVLFPLPFQKIPWGAHRRSPSPGGSGLGQQRQEPRVVPRARAGSSRAPLTLGCEAGLASLQLGGLRTNFCRAEPHGQGAGVRPGREVAREPPSRSVRDALHGRRSAPPEAPGPATLPGARGSGAVPTYFFLLHEPHKGCPLDLHGLALSVVEGQDEVEEVGFPQIGRRLLLKVSAGQTHPAAAKDAELDG